MIDRKKTDEVVFCFDPKMMTTGDICGKVKKTKIRGQVQAGSQTCDELKMYSEQNLFEKLSIGG